jgi:hypothetical protein
MAGIKVGAAAPITAAIARLSWIWQHGGIHLGEEKTCLFFLGRKGLLLLLNRLLALAFPCPVV